MQDETRAVPKALATLGATLKLLAVDLPMPDELGAAGEAFGAIQANIGFLLQVGPLVNQEVGAMVEATAAVGAAVIFLTGLHPLVLRELGTVGKALPTGWVGVPVLGVRLLMPHPLGAVTKTPPTLRAIVGSLAGVGPPMPHQLRAVLEALVALGSLVGPP